MDVTLPAVRAFVAVARAGSFRGAATSLGVSQPTVSAAVKRLEAGAGRPLLIRDRDGVRLTELGGRLLAHAVAVTTAADELEALLAGDTSGLTVGFMGEAAGTRTSRLFDGIRRASGREVRPRRFDFDDPSCGLLAGTSDLAVVWPPLSTGDALEVLVLGSDRRAVAVPAGDPLARLAEVGPADLAGRVWVVPRSPDPVWRAFRHPGSIGVGDIAGEVESRAIEETLELVAAGQGIALLSQSTDDHYARAGVVFVLLSDGCRCTTAVAWRRADTRPVIARILAGL
ncbi:LysR family transcriptional regulator [Streptosporangium roseum]|uniref:Transcriptional regulator-LysR family n=1 Tax=Streptosporangium roseum (strain ATCC 12428 / DSM 43021 / JCM 3005 / KCTC 9067 / NCIMB 10171 / NRRL 2505 / NI 9100) TaxID=479432 RepID=D2ATY6_STRRD|nr:LysR family transcriptional regulator [Streptosporangium roseum]ACZ88641.1 putative transcriptional regulator-LysR family [Streptosporangium roseum DSM 43021]